jgi:pimeloyl-ACP methyl ester carboxylesterase
MPFQGAEAEPLPGGLGSDGEAIDQCGHYLPEEQPEAVAEKMLAFLK